MSGLLKLKTSLVDIENVNDKYRFIMLLDENPERFISVQETHDGKWSHENTCSFDYNELIKYDAIIIGEVVLNYNTRDLINELHKLKM